MNYRGPGSTRYVPHASPACAEGCQMAMAQQVAATAAAITTQMGTKSMSQALWCDQGGHAFSERDPGRKRITIDALDDDGVTVKEFRDFCGQCATAAGLTGPRKTRPRELSTTEPDDRDAG